MTLEYVKFDLSVNPNGGSWNGSTSSKMGVGENVTIANPTRTGYTFAGWDISGTGSSINGTTFTMGTANTTLTAKWTVNSYTVAVTPGTGIETVGGAGTYTYGQSVTVTAKLKGNTDRYSYGWSNWTGSGVAGSNRQDYTFTMPAGNVSLTANGTETIKSYLQKVQVRYENGDGTYTEYSDVINRNYNYGEKVSWSRAQDGTYEAGSIQEYTVTGAKTTQVTIKRRKYQVTTNKGTGIKEVTGAGTYRAGQTVTVSATLKDITPQYSYGWTNWTSADISNSNNKSYTFTMPTKNVTITANGTETTRSYQQIIQYRYQDANGNYPSIYTNAINQTVNYGAGVNWSTGNIRGFNTAMYESQNLAYTVTGAKTTNIDIPRKTYELTVNKGTGIANLTGANTGTYRAGQTITVNATLTPGYAWTNWTGAGVGNSNNQEYTFNMPTTPATVTANATLITYNIGYTLNRRNSNRKPNKL